jgi:hypothetical protein
VATVNSQKAVIDTGHSPGESRHVGKILTQRDIASKMRISAVPGSTLGLFTNTKDWSHSMKAETRLLQAVQPPDTTHDATQAGPTQTAHSHLATCMRTLLFALPLFALGISCMGESPTGPRISDQAPAAQTTLAIFHDRPIEDDLWQALVTSLHEELASIATETRGPAAENASADAGSSIQIIRGDTILPGISVDKSIAVYLQGECKTTPTPHAELYGQRQPWVAGALGWVNMTNGHIDPFIHVDCKRIGEMLGVVGIGRSRDQRNQLMANAIARVVTHEWIHVATQNPRHSRHGVGKAEFGIEDLLQRSSKSIMEQGTASRSADRESSPKFVQPSAPVPSEQARLRGTK